MSGSGTSWLRRHPALALLAVNLGVFVLIGVTAEIFLRLFIPYHPGYYVSVGGTSREVEYPYGTIKINSHGYADDEFELSKPERVGYFGDSVTYGVGAGYGYRVTELLETAYPDREHLNLGVIGLSVSKKEIAKAQELSKSFGLTHAVYFFNLNDILPDALLSGSDKPTSVKARDGILRRFDWLRGKSYLYTWLRNTVRTFLASRGIGFHGYSAYELHPEKSREILEETAQRVNAFAAGLAEVGVETIIVMLPYEMQISEEAAARYAELGVDWEDGFLDGSAQRIMEAHIDPSMRTIDAYHAFVTTDVAGSRAANGLGQYFVYNRGDKLDWNHPNREGHRAIARYLAAEGIFGVPEVPIAARDEPAGVAR